MIDEVEDFTEEYPDGITENGIYTLSQTKGLQIGVNVANGGAPFIATYTITGQDEDGSYSLSCDKTAEEIMAAFSSQIVLAKMDISAMREEPANTLIVYGQLSMTVVSSVPIFSVAIYHPSMFGNAIMLGTIIHQGMSPQAIIIPFSPSTLEASYDSSTNTLNFYD